jgi:hypothetical protein
MIIATIGFQQFAINPSDVVPLISAMSKAVAIEQLPIDDGIERYFKTNEPTIILSIVLSAQILSDEQSKEIIKKRAERAEREFQQLTEQQ